MIDFSKPLMTKRGNSVRILCKDRLCDGCDDKYQVVGLELVQNIEYERSWTIEGKYLNGDNHLDLVNIKEKKWVNLYKSSSDTIISGSIYSTKEEAIKNIFYSQIYIKTIEIEVP